MNINSRSLPLRPVVALLLFTGALLNGCSGIEKAPPRSTPARVSPSAQRDLPEILRGTIASEVVVRGYQHETSPGYRPIIARGYGLVVRLNGTGSRQISPQLRAYMLSEAARGGFGGERFGDNIRRMTPEQLLDSPDTAVVIVEAIVPQGARAGTKFDVRVYAEPQSGTTSLEGGTLYTTMLRPGPLSMGSRQAFEVASAYGPVFVNPFAEPGAIGEDSILRTAGRILHGGLVLKDMPLKLQLVNPSHARAAVLQNAINTRFPEDPGQKQPTARGESDELIEITVPPSWADNTEEFMDLLLHTTIMQAHPEAVAMAIKRSLLANPGMFYRSASLRWQALGVRVLPVIKDLYEHPEELPRIAALRAGARLDDGLVIPHLIAMSESASAGARIQAIELLEDMRTNPRIDATLRALLDDDDVDVRLRAYEALVVRSDPFMDRSSVDGKFVLDVIKSGKPLVYITEMGQPRIAVFGQGIALERPLTVSTWSNRLMVKGDSGDSHVEVYYREPSAIEGTILRVKPELKDFIKFLAHKTTALDPTPGLNLTYGETVGALYHIWKQQRLPADFKLEQDRILAAIMRVQTESEGETIERPELSAERLESAAPPEADMQSDLGRMLDGGTSAPLRTQQQPSDPAMPAPPRPEGGGR